MQTLGMMVFFLYQSVTGLPCDSMVDSKMYVVANNGLVLRANPSRDSDKVFLLPFGAEVQFISLSNEDKVDGKWGAWVQIRYGKFSGYVWGNYLLKYKPVRDDILFQGAYKEVVDLEKDTPSEIRLEKNNSGSYLLNQCQGFSTVALNWYLVSTNQGDLICLVLHSADFVDERLPSIYTLKIDKKKLMYNQFVPEKTRINMGCDFHKHDIFIKVE